MAGKKSSNRKRKEPAGRATSASLASSSSDRENGQAAVQEDSQIIDDSSLRSRQQRSAAATGSRPQPEDQLRDFLSHTILPQFRQQPQHPQQGQPQAYSNLLAHHLASAQQHHQQQQQQQTPSLPHHQEQSTFASSSHAESPLTSLLLTLRTPQPTQQNPPPNPLQTHPSTHHRGGPRLHQGILPRREGFTQQSEPPRLSLLRDQSVQNYIETQALRLLNAQRTTMYPHQQNQHQPEIQQLVQTLPRQSQTTTQLPLSQVLHQLLQTTPARTETTDALGGSAQAEPIFSSASSRLDQHSPSRSPPPPPNAQKSKEVAHKRQQRIALQEPYQIGASLHLEPSQPTQHNRQSSGEGADQFNFAKAEASSSSKYSSTEDPTHKQDSNSNKNKNSKDSSSNTTATTTITTTTTPNMVGSSSSSSDHDIGSLFDMGLGSYFNANPREEEDNFVRIACKARRGMGPDHNFRTAFFRVARSALKHGDGLECSHEQCRKDGIRFLYCSVCDEAVAKANFSTRHGHGLKRQQQQLAGGVQNPAAAGAAADDYSYNNTTSRTKSEKQKATDPTQAKRIAPPKIRKDSKKSSRGGVTTADTTAVSRYDQHDQVQPSTIITRTSSTTSSTLSSEARASKKSHPSSTLVNTTKYDSTEDPQGADGFNSRNKKKRRLDSSTEQTSKGDIEKVSLPAGCGTAADEGDKAISTKIKKEPESFLHAEPENLGHCEDDKEAPNTQEDNTKGDAPTRQVSIRGSAAEGGNEMMADDDGATVRAPISASSRRQDEHPSIDENIDQDQTNTRADNAQLSPRSKRRQQWFELLEERQTRVRDKAHLQDWLTRVLACSDPNDSDLVEDANNGAD